MNKKLLEKKKTIESIEKGYKFQGFVHTTSLQNFKSIMNSEYK